MVSTNTKLAEALRRLIGASMVAMTDQELATGETLSAWEDANEALAAHDAEQAALRDLECPPDPEMVDRALAAADQKRAYALAARQQAQVPEGFVLVPVEPVVPYLYVYEYDSPFGLNREFYPSGWNGQKPTRTVPLYTTPQPAQAERVGLTDEQIAEGRYRTWAAEPEDAPEAWSFLRGARWAESALAVRWGVKLGATTGEQR